MHSNNGDNMARILIIIGSRREGNSAILAKKIKEAMKKERISVDIITPGIKKFIYVRDVWIVMKQVSVILKMTW